jgi:small subunit ribosomal protein S3
MENGAMGVQITISGKLRGDRSAFEKHTAGILPRAGHHAEVIVDEDIVHVRTAMGLIGIRIRIAINEKNIPEFELKTQKPKKAKQVKDTDSGKMRDETEVERKARTESEQIAIEEEKMKELETLEEEEAKLL